jgi:hypothetical protein
VDEQDIVWITDFSANALVSFNPQTEQFQTFNFATANAAVRQLLGRPGEIWGAESSLDRLFVLYTTPKQTTDLKELIMPENKTKATAESVKDFLDAVPDETKRADSYAILDLMKEVSGFEPQMWGTSIVGFGSYHYKYETGREGDMPMIGFSPRKQNLTLYIMGGFEGYEGLLKRLGKHSLGKSCLYVKRLSDVDVSTLKALVAQSFNYMQDKSKS